MNEEKYAVPFEIILSAGNSKAASFAAIEAAKGGDFEEAKNSLKEAEQEMKAAHDAQLDLMQNEAEGNPVEVNIMLVHAQDHLTMATMARDLAEEFVDVYRVLYELKHTEK